MNRELLARVRDRIAEVGNEHCNMHAWSEGKPQAAGDPECGTTACIAGWTLAVLNGAFDVGTYKGDVQFDAADALGISRKAAGHLFLSDWPDHYDLLALDEGDAKGMLSLLDAILDGRVVFDDDGRLVDLEEQLADEVEEMAQ